MRRNVRVLAVAMTMAGLTAGQVAAAPDTTEPTDTSAATTGTASGTALDATATTAGTSVPAEPWTAPTDACIDGDAANAPIEGAVTIGAAMPLSGGPAASAFAPIAEGFRAYFDDVNERAPIEGHELTAVIEDDQFNPALTPGVINGLLDQGADVISSTLGTPNNIAVRDLLNDECVPQLLAVSGAPDFADAAAYPWTIGGQMSYDVEVGAYVNHIAATHPDGASVGIFYVNTEYGLYYLDALNEAGPAAGLELVAEQTIEVTDTAPPTAQANALAAAAPDAIIAVPIGAGCPAFLSELGNARAANPGWEPAVYITSSCGQPAILAAAADAANGVLTVQTGGLVDFAAAGAADDPDVAHFLEVMEGRGQSAAASTAAVGWTLAETTAEAIRQAAASPEGLSRASIMTAARNLDFAPTLARDGVSYTTQGEQDQEYVEDVQIIQFDVASGTFADVGELDTSARSS